MPEAAPFLMQEIEESIDYSSTLMYGDNGVGKTHLTATCVDVEEMRDVFMISFEKSQKTLSRWKGNPHILITKINSYKQFAYAHEWLRQHIVARDANNIEQLRALESYATGVPIDQIKEPRRFQTVIIDSITEAQLYCMYLIKGIDPDTYNLATIPDAAQFQDWGQSREMVRFLMQQYRDLAIHSIFIADVDDTEQDAYKNTIYKPMLPGKLSKDAVRIVDTVGFYMAAKQEQGILRRLLLQGSENFKAKNRFKQDIEFIDNPCWADLFALDLD